MLTDLFAGRMDVPKAMAELRAIASGLGLPFGERERTYNSRRAQEIGKWADDEGVGDAYRDAVFRAYFSAGENISEISVLSAICEEIGLPGDQVEMSLTSKRYADAVDEDWQRVAQYGVSSIPSRLYQDRVLVGYRPAQELISLIDSL